MRNLIFSFLVVLALVSFPLSAQTLAGPVVSAQAFPAVQPVAIGVPFTAAVVLQIQPGWHVNAHEGIPDFFIPLEVFLCPNSPLSLVGKVRYESGIPKSLAGESKPFAVYQGGTTLFLDLVLTSGAAVGPLPAKLQARYQACNDQVCMAPMNLPVNLDLTVGSSGQAVIPIHPEVFQNPLASPSQAAENIIAKFFREKGILITFVLIFLGGLALNLTPCVYPMIPLTVSYFGSQKAEKPLVILNRAFAYVLGISVTYSSLGVTAALTGRILGSTLQSPLVLVGISLVLMVLSFSMFGLYEIQAPNWLLNQVASGNTQGWIGALGMGLVFGIVAAPCVDPFSIGLLTYVAAKANPFLGFILFFTLSLGLGFPYLWLGFFSGEIGRLPKAGTWMVWVKKVFGLVLLGMPLYFLAPLLPEGFNRLAVPAYLGIGGILLGWIFAGQSVEERFKMFQRIFGVVLILGALGLFQAWPKPVESYFKPFDLALLSRAQAEGKPVLVDFSASWCIPCKELEIKTFSDARVREALLNWVLLKADLTQYSSGPVEALKKKFAIMGVPTMVFVEPNGREKEDLRAVGFISADELLQKIHKLSN